MGEYEPRITEHCLNLVEQLSARANKPVDITSWISYLGFDVMGDLVFGKSFNMVGTAGDHFVVSLFNDLQPFTGLLQCIPWLFMLFLRLPGVSDKRTTWIDWCADQVRERRKVRWTAITCRRYLALIISRQDDLETISFLTFLVKRWKTIKRSILMRET